MKSIAPAAKAQKGFRGIYSLADRKAGKSISISLWESEEDATATEWSGFYQEQVAKGDHLFTAPQICEGYDVVIQA